MDEIDLLLIKTLLMDSRTPYRELAEKLDLSVNAVHKRIQSLMDEGVIHTFTTKLNLPALGASTAIIYGLSRGKTDEVCAALGEDEHIYWVSHGSGGFIYVGAYLRNIAELEEVVGLVRSRGLVDNPTVGIMAMPLPDAKELDLSKLDYRIIKVLSRDSRRPVSEIAEVLNTSAKTVRRRLDRMLENKLIECSIEWYPDKSNDIISMFHIKLAPSIDRIQFAFSMLNKFSPNSLFFFLFSNLPDTILFCTWSSNTKEVNEQRRRLDAEEGVVSSVPVILFSGHVYDTWRERLVDEKLAIKPSS
ncbi:MAG: Lrp/AsnC family transcriptional regulator [Candidatus Saccharibacteria bacterium]